MREEEIKPALQDIGLSSGEIQVYLALLKRGQSTVHEIKKETGLHRTTIYDFLEKLGNKGLVSDVIVHGAHQFTAGAPQRLFDYLESKKENLVTVFDALVGLQQREKQKISVEVLRGLEGFRRVTNEIIRAKKELLIFGVDEKEFERKLSIEMKQVFRREKEVGITERIITWDGAVIYDEPNLEYRSIPKKYFSPTPTFVFADFVCIHIWEPFTIILIKNKELSRSYRNYFELLWKMARPVKSKKQENGNL